MNDWESAPSNDGWESPKSNDGWESAGDGGFSTALKESFTGIGNTVDKFGSALASIPAGIMGGPEARDEIFKNMEDRIKTRSEWANPKNLSTTPTNRVLSSLATLPMGLISAGLSPFDVGSSQIKNGEDLTTAAQSAGVSGVGNLIGLVLPGFAQLKAPLQIAFNGLSNAAQQALSDLIISHLSKTKKSQEEFAPTWEKAITAFSIGGLAGAAHALDHGIKSVSSKKQLSKLDNLDKNVPVEQPSVPIEKIPQQMELPLEVSAQQIAERRGAEIGQPDLFGPQNIPKADIGTPISDQVEMRRAIERDQLLKAQQEHLPFISSPEQIAEMQNRNSPQADMFGTPKDVTPEGMVARQEQKQLSVYERAQQQLAERQAALEFEVKRQAALDNGAAERIRQQNASTGFNDWQVGRATDEAAQTHDFLSRAQQSEIDTTPHGDRPAQYGFTDTGGRVDENGIPIRADLSMEAQNLQDPLQRNLWGDELPRKSEQEGIPLTEAIDSMPDLPWKTERDAGIDLLNKGAMGPDWRLEDSIADANALHPQSINIPTGQNLPPKGPRSQRGGIDPDLLTLGMAKHVEKLRDFIQGISKVGLHHQTSAEEYLAKNIPGMKESLANRITQSDPPSKIIADSIAPGTSDIPELGLSTNLQSGPELTAAKYKNNPLLLGAGRIMHEAVNKTELQIKQLVRPVQDAFQNLSVSHRIELAELLKKEMFADKRYSEEQLLSAGFTKKQVDAYNMLRAAQKERLDAANAGRAALGKKPITEKEAYLASTFNGDWQFSVLDKEGKPAWFVRTQTKAEAIAAQKYLAKHFGDQLNLKDSKIEMRGDSSKYNASMPRDVMGAYSDMLVHFTDNPQLTAAIKEAMQSFLQDKGYTAGGHNRHFMEKINIRGFEGDKPWLSAKENANALLQAQTNYLKSATQWNNHQEAMAKMKEILSDETLQKERPNAMDYLRKVEAAQLGMPSNVMAAAERSLASLLPAYFKGTVALGRSRSYIYGGVGGLKSALYLQLLGLNIPHMIATPFQALMTVPAQHRVLTTEGFTHNVAKTTMTALSDFTSGMLIHQLHELSGKTIEVPMTPLGKKALTYAEDNGIIEKNIFNENVQLGDSAVGAAAQKLLGGTIAFPEKVTRLATFLSFVHHLDASGKFGSEMEVLRRAKELTDRSVTSFRSVDRPMIVNKLGATGNLAYTFKSFLFNEFNQLGQLARKAGEYFDTKGKSGAISPLAIHLASIGLVGGMLSVPFVNEMDGMWNLFKDFVAEHAPGQYNNVKGNGLKSAIIEHLPDFASYGAASAMLGTALQSRLSMDVFDPEHPFKNMFPLTQDIKEATTGLASLTDPTSSTITQAIYTQMPSLIKGQMETHMPIFHGVDRGDGTSTAMNPNKLEQHDSLDHLRTKEDWNQRKYGMTSLAEAKDTQTRYSNNAETKRIGTALDVIGTKIYDAIKRDNDADKEKWIRKYLELNPDKNALNESVQKNVKDENLTPSERELKEQMTLRQLYDFMRLRKTRGQDTQ